ncbi:retrotransposon protein, partial [Trifolium medium]|nr:retrotransposon protein [Trifolium medium]
AVWSGLTPSVKHLKVFGSLSYKHVPDSKRKKLDEKSEHVIFVGYHRTGAYRLYNPITKKTTISRDVSISEEEQWDWEVCSSTRSEHALLHAKKKPIAAKWVHKGNHLPNGSSVKARSVARGLSQKSGIDSNEMFCQSENQVNCQSVQLDFKSAVENGKLENEVYVEQPQSFKVEGADDKVPKEQEELELMVDILTKLLNIERFKDLKKMLKLTSLEHLNKGGVLKCNSNALSDVENKTRLNCQL